jgi:hypothetical protein
MDAFEAVSPAKPSVTAGKKLFTPAEANRSLVLVRRIVADVVSNYRRLRELHEKYQTLDQQGDLFEAEETRKAYVAITDHLAELREELESVGCELKDFELGLADFPSIREGREVYLCWKLGEEQVTHWHELNAGYASRKPIETQA